VPVAFLALDNKEAAAQSTTSLLAAVWDQLSVGKPISPEVHELYNNHDAGRRPPSLEEIYRVLQVTVEDSCAFVVVDGLDKYPEDDRDTLLRHLSRLGAGVRLLFTSRSCISIDHIITNVETLDVPENEEDPNNQSAKPIRLLEDIDESATLRESSERKNVKRNNRV
jgi:hypothetical protein